MTNRRLVRMLAAVCGAVVLSLPGAAPAMGSTTEGEGGSPAHAVSHPQRSGYYLAAADGGVFAFGNALFHGSMAGRPLRAPIVDIEATRVKSHDASGNPARLHSTEGYYLAAADGGVFAFGNARFYGSMAGKRLAAPIVAIASTPSSGGYWLLGRDGGMFAFGDANNFSLGTSNLKPPIVDFDLAVVVTPMPGTGPGPEEPEDLDVWYGTVRTNSTPVWSSPAPSGTLAAPVVAIAAAAGWRHYLAAADGGVFAFGSAPFYGSMAGKPLAAPVVDMVETGFGYLLAAADGGVFAFGNAPFLGSMAGRPLAAPIIGMS